MEDLYFGWLKGEAKGGKEDATMLNGFFKGVEGFEGEAYVCLVVGMGLGRVVQRGLGNYERPRPRPVFMMCWAKPM